VTATGPVRARAPAKINLALHVGPARPDGYHELATVYQAVDLYDEVTAEPHPGGAVAVRTLDPQGAPVDGVADDATHLAVRAAEALRERAGLRLGVRLTVRKRIPVAGGMAGGSADAAAALVACDALWGLGTDHETLLDVAAGLGSDVPFALVGETALGTGRGERVRPVPAAGRSTWLVVASRPGLPAAEVYAAADRVRAGTDVGPPAVHPRLLDAVRAGDVPRLARGVRNDLQRAAVSLRPALADVLDAGVRAGARVGLVSGSGPTLLLLVRDDAEAASVGAAVGPVAERLLSGATLRIVHGPVAGATVVPAP